MKQKLMQTVIFTFLMAVIVSGCQKQLASLPMSSQQIYYFDESKPALIKQPLSEEFDQLGSPQEQVEYIISHLIDSKLTKKVILSDNLKEDPTVKFYFTPKYNDLSPVEKIGIRSSVVYSLAELEFINGVEFYVDDMPLTTSSGKTVGVIYPSQIKLDVLDPNPATTPYTLSLYYANGQGRLEKEVRGIIVSESASVEKLLIEELINGPSVDGLKPVMPKDVKVNEVKVTNGICYVDLSFDVKSKFFNSDQEKYLMLYSIVDSLTELPQIKKVVIYLDGQSGKAFTKEIDFGDTLERNEGFINNKKS